MRNLLIAIVVLTTSGLALGKGEKARTVELTVTEKGFEPTNVKVKKGELLNLVVTRKTDSTCAKDIIMPDYDVKKDLPLNKAVTIAIEAKKTGEFKYSCGMNMLGGVLTVE